MSSYPSTPAPSDPAGSAASPGTAPPPSTTLAIRLIWGLVALSVISTLLSFLYLDEMVQAALDNAGVQGLNEDSARAGAVVGAVVGAAIGVLIYALLAYFIGHRRNWARIVYTVLAGLGVLAGLIGFMTGGGTGQPIVLTLLSVLSLVLTLGVLYLLWTKESSAWLTGRS